MDDATGSSKINSSQNGFLLRIEVHRMFDQYLISINPDDSCMKGWNNPLPIGQSAEEPPGGCRSKA